MSRVKKTHERNINIDLSNIIINKESDLDEDITSSEENGSLKTKKSVKATEKKSTKKTSKNVKFKTENETKMVDDENTETINTETTVVKTETTVVKTETRLQTSLLHSPYIETSLMCPIMLNPTQMDNKIKLHLKSNLNNYIKGRCYLNYGFIVKINKIEEISDGRLEEEDTTCSAKFIVKFSCRLCLPARNHEIICKIDRINTELISALNGPIIGLITSDSINKDKFFIDNDRNIRITNSSELLESSMYIRIFIKTFTFSNYDTNIIAISRLEDMATDEEIIIYEKEQHYNNN
jgi:DNA-directed RNA polymerase subunit E'/Rpb7